MQAIAEAARRICPQFGHDPAVCIMQAYHISRNGKAAARWNCWDLPGGHGDRSDVIAVVARPVGAPEYLRPIKRSLSTFSGPDAAVRAWCRFVR